VTSEELHSPLHCQRALPDRKTAKCRKPKVETFIETNSALNIVLFHQEHINEDVGRLA
jgi:hypothetical protein